MITALTLTGLLGVATFTATVMATPTPPGDFSTGDFTANTTVSEDSMALLPVTGGRPSEAFMSEQWDQAAMGVDSAANSSLLNQSYTVSMEIAPGDTLMSVLLTAGIDRTTAHTLVQSLSEVFNPRGLRPKQTLDLTILPAFAQKPASVEALNFHPDGLREFVVTRTQDGYQSAELLRPVNDHIVRSEGTIDSSLYTAARSAGVPMPVLGSLINIFSFDVDFQREVQPGDSFALMFSESRTDEGETVDFGDILLAEMSVNGTLKRFYRFVDDDNRLDYYDEKGQSVRRALLRTPVEGARISSGFGARKHPILGYTKMHKGLDFAAPTGTPIYAAGDGVVEVAGRNGGYGRYIRIRHNGTYSTAYAHLSRIDSRVKAGARVQQRQIIGYVGTSGRSTGPHLHYEVLVNGKQTNPLGVKLPTGKTLTGAELARFQRLRSEIESQYAAIEPTTQVAQAN